MQALLLAYMSLTLAGELWARMIHADVCAPSILIERHLLAARACPLLRIFTMSLRQLEE